MRVKISRFVNHYLLRGKNQMFSSRAYIEHHPRVERFIDWFFYKIRGEQNHCKNSFIWEKTNEAKKEANQIRSEKTEGETSGD